MHIQDNDTQRNLSTVSEPIEMKQNLVIGINNQNSTELVLLCSSDWCQWTGTHKLVQ